MKVRPIFAWYDIWVGFFWDQSKRCLYIFPIPMLGVVIQFGDHRPPHDILMSMERDSLYFSHFGRGDVTARKEGHEDMLSLQRLMLTTQGVSRQEAARMVVETDALSAARKDT